MSRDARNVAILVTILLSFFLTFAQEARAQCGTLTKEDGDPGFAGQIVSTSVDRIAAGTPGAWAGAPNAGAVYVFRLHFGVWIQEAKLIAPTPAANQYMGRAVSINGPWGFAGVIDGNSDNGYDPGVVHVYHRVGTTWSYNTTLTPSDNMSDVSFGKSVSVDGDRAVIAGTGAYVFRYDGANWIEESKLTTSASVVDIENDTVVVGTGYQDSPFPEDVPAGYVFRLVAGIWTQESELLVPTKYSYPAANRSIDGVSLSGDVVVLLADQRNEAYVYERQGGTWPQVDTLGSNVNEPFVSVGIDGDLIVAGVQTATQPDGSRGAVYIYSRAGTNWVRTSRLSPPGTPPTSWGGSVAISANQFVAGTNSQYAYAYSSVPSATDCNYNCVSDATEIQTSSAADCNSNGVLDGCDLAACDGSLSCGDCDRNGVPDGCDLSDCSGNPLCSDCNLNGILDSCDIASANGNLSLSDCNQNGQPDACDIGSGAEFDVNFNSVPDTCECSLFETISELAVDASSGSRTVSASLDRIAVTHPARVFRQVGNEWLVELDLGEEYGLVSIDGDRLLASHADGPKVYAFDGVNWQHEATLSAVGGSDFVLRGDLAVVGTGHETPSGWEYDAKVFRRDPGGWVEEAVLIPSDSQPGDLFGYSVATDGVRAVVGAVGPVHGPANGTAYVFRREGTSWIEEQKIVRTDVSTFFGVSLAIEGPLMIIGTSSNVVHSYRLQDGEWTEEIGALAPIQGIGQEDRVFGYSLDLKNGALLIGSPWPGTVQAGSAHLFHRIGDTWNPSRRFGPGPAPRRDFGISVALATNAAAMGCNFYPAFAFSDLTPDCDGNGQNDLCQVTAALSSDCNANSLPDACDISSGLSSDAANDGVPDECQCVPISCADNNVCTHDSCMVGQVCNHAVLATLKFGDVNNDSAVNLDDILCENAGFSGHFTVACPLERVDLVPCPANDGIVTLDDILAVLKAFGGGVSAGCTSDLCAP